MNLFGIIAFCIFSIGIGLAIEGCTYLEWLHGRPHSRQRPIHFSSHFGNHLHSS